ncbi:MAG: DUF92 domain-containing protein, partial [Chloroflexi bacterium]|nr:DUF92 domain-containing protein [Chloroflexota bacterium]
SLVDSALGASVQALYYCPVCDRLTESSRHACGSATRIIRGHPWMTNDTVNCCATMTGAAIGALWEIAMSNHKAGEAHNHQLKQAACI